MKRTKTKIAGIPAIIWGEDSDKAFIFVHGKSSAKEYAEDFAAVADKKGYMTISFDLPGHGEKKDDGSRLDIWTASEELAKIYDFAAGKYARLSLFACSIGAYFSMMNYADKMLERCLFQSPIVDLERLIRQMFQWFNVSEAELREKRYIETPFEPLSWDYFRFACEHPVKKWDFPTSVLYAAHDNLQPREALDAFCSRFGCRLSVAPDSEHPFMGEGDRELFIAWAEKELEI